MTKINKNSHILHLPKATQYYHNFHNNAALRAQTVNNFPIIERLLLVLLFMFKIISIIYFYKNMDIIINNFNMDYFNNNLFSFFGGDETNSGGGSQSNPLTDPTSVWPKGIPQGYGVVGTGLGVYYALHRIGGLSPRGKVIAAISAMGTTTAITFSTIILENSVGFNRLMFGLTEYNRTKQWPSLDMIYKPSDAEVNKSATETMGAHGVNKNNINLSDVEQGLTANGFDDPTKSQILEEISKISKKFLPDLNLDFNNLLDRFFEIIFSVLQPVRVTGYLDDLIGQQIAIKAVSLLLICSAILSFIAYILNIIFYINKNYLINKFKNKYIERG